MASSSASPSSNPGLYRSQLDQDTVKALVRHLFDPAGPPSRSRTRGLISPNLVIDWPFLPCSEPSPIAGMISRDPRDRYDLPSTPSKRRRHTASAQSLALFRLPAVFVNHVPGGMARWDLDILDVTDISKEPRVYSDPARPLLHIIPGSSRWRATLVWTLQVKPLPKAILSRVPGSQKLDEILTLEYTSHIRHVELIFSPTQAEIDEAARQQGLLAMVAGPSSSTALLRSTPKAPDLRVQLVRVRYSGIGFSPAVQLAIPLYSRLREFVPWLLSLLLAPAYGILLLLGLDHSNRSLDSAVRRRKRQQRREWVQAQADSALEETSDIKGKGKALELLGSASRRDEDEDAMSSASAPTASEASTSDSFVIESDYHRAMRHSHVYVEQTQALVKSFLLLAHEMSQEVGVIGWGVRQLVYLAVEVGLMAAGVGKDVLLAAEEERTRPLEPSRRRRMREHARERIESQVKDSSPPPVLPRRPRGHKRVSFSLAQPPGISAEATMEAAMTTSSGSDDSGPRSQVGSAASVPSHPLPSIDTAGERATDNTPSRYYENYGRPAVTVQSPLADVRAQVAELAALEARGRRQSLDELYQGDTDPTTSPSPETEIGTALGIEFGPEASRGEGKAQKIEVKSGDEQTGKEGPPLVPHQTLEVHGAVTPTPRPALDSGSTANTPELSPEITKREVDAAESAGAEDGSLASTAPVEPEERRASVASVASPVTPSEMTLTGMDWRSIGQHEHCQTEGICPQKQVVVSSLAMERHSAGSGLASSGHVEGNGSLKGKKIEEEACASASASTQTAVSTGLASTVDTETNKTGSGSGSGSGSKKKKHKKKSKASKPGTGAPPILGQKTGFE